MTFNRYLTVAVDGVVVTSDDDVAQVAWYINDPARAGSAWHVDQTAPFDVSGGSVTSAVPFDLDTLGEGTHTVTAVITLTDTTEVVDTATFTYSPAQSEDQPEQIPVQSATASSWQTNPDNLPEHAIDGNTATFWAAQGSGETLTLDLGTVQTVGFVDIAWNKGDVRTDDFDLQTSSDGTTWENVFHGRSSGGTLAKQRFRFVPTAARYFRYVGYTNADTEWNTVVEVTPWTPDLELAAPPPTPGLAVVAQDQAAALKIDRGFGPWATQFRIERATAASGPWTVVDTTTGLTYTDAGLTNGTPYWWRVVAINSDGAATSDTVTETPSGQEAVLWFDLSLADLGLVGGGVKATAQTVMETVTKGWTSILHGGIGLDTTYITDGTVSGIAPDYDGRYGRILAFKHPPNEKYSGNWNGLIRFPDQKRARFEFKTMYGTQWDVSKPMGKFWGLGGVSAGGSDTAANKPPMHGEDPVEPGEGWSARRTRHSEAAPLDYIYDPLKQLDEYHDNPYGNRAWWGAPGSDVGDNSHVDGWRQSSAWKMQNGVWYEVRQDIDVEEPWGHAGDVLQEQHGYSGYGTIRTYVKIGGVWTLMSLYLGMLTTAGADVNCLLAHHYESSDTQNTEVWYYVADATVTAL